MKIQSTKTIHSGPVRLVVYGQQGTGKTSLAKTLQGKTIIGSLESGLLSLKGSEISFVDLTKDDDGKPLATAKAKFERTVTFLKSPLIQEFDNVVLDSLTEFGAVVKGFVEETEAAAIEKNKFHLWSRIGIITTYLIHLVKDTMKPNFIFLCTEDCKEDDDKRMFYMPQYPGSASLDAILGLNDEIYRLSIDGAGKRWLYTQPGARFKAKSRGATDGSILPVEEANLGSIFERIKTLKPKQGEANGTTNNQTPTKPQGPGNGSNQNTRTSVVKA